MPRTTRARKPRWQRRPEARAEELIDAALDVFGERGFARARLEDVARRAGVSKGTVYLYFDSKEALFREMVRATKGSAIARAEAFSEQFQGSARELLVQLMRRIWAHQGDPRQVSLSRLVQSEIRNFPELAQFYFEEVTLRARHLLERVLARGVAQGEFRPEQARFAARGIPALLLTLCSHQCLFAGFDPAPLPGEVIIDDAVDFILHGVLARARAPRNGT
jgi:AcrR family transcriptional regulator